MFRFSKKPSSGSHSQSLDKITRLVQCWYRRRADVVSAMAAYVMYKIIQTKKGETKVGVFYILRISCTKF